MRAVDTNVLVRLIAEDDPVQVAISERLTLEPFIVLPTVVLETVWVLEKTYRMPPGQVSGRVSTLLGNLNAIVVSGGAIEWALARYETGADFADALHIALARDANADRFATFDRGIAKSIAETPVELETLS